MREFSYVDDHMTCRFNLSLGEFIIIENGLSDEILLALSYKTPKAIDTYFDYLILTIDDFWLFSDSLSKYTRLYPGYDLCKKSNVTQNPTHMDIYKNPR